MKAKVKSEAKGSLIKKAYTVEWTPLAADSNTSVASTTTTSGTKTRRNAAATNQRTNRFTNIENGLTPFNFSKGYIDVREAVSLCQKAYWNYSVVRNVIDLMTEFSVNSIHFKGGSSKSREFFTALWEKLGLRSIEDKYFREYYRSGTVIYYRLDAELNAEDFTKITQTFGSDVSKAAKKKTLPAKYIILNPADILAQGNMSFIDGKYYKLLNDYEIERLRNPQTEEDKNILNALDAKTRELIKNKLASHVAMPLDSSKLVVSFYKRQDYEPFAVPMIYPVLEDINWKAEMKKQDMAITRTMQQAILLVTMGAEPDKGGVNQKNIEAMQAIFENESVGRVLIADYTTKAAFVIPDIANLLDPKKYQSIDKDINVGLNNVLFGSDEKFSNQSIKTQIFIERLKQARRAFIDDFLMPETKRIAKAIGMKNYPTPFFEDFELRDELEWAKVYTRMMELGALTPDENVKAIETGLLPTKEESETDQEEFRKLRDKGFYEPIVGGPHSQEQLQDSTNKHQLKLAEKQGEIQKDANKELNQQKLEHNDEMHQIKVQHQGQVNKVKISKMKGRPSGTSAPKKSATVGTFSLSKLKDNLILADKLQKSVEASLLKKFNLKELSEDQKAISNQISDLIVTNEEPEVWLDKAEDYIKNPIGANEERAKEIDEIAYAHQVDNYVASLLLVSQN